ncbi:hypothetical protein INS49_014349 [Diaporthe citri]|uniref:uncharacterized protein n=1 Tax=Diaporthe citri TaxID=83186 RepID=UPI001C81A2AC|nr:uncharacterized protein INS49_014349 [Diaporthe citri]KAG6358465.1 hypothetical protein INS49_014349 [Diaporthe citri]
MVQVRTPANSIFEYLTHENPRLTALAQMSTQSRNEDWYTPKKVEKWKDFDFSMSKKIFGAQLWAECQASRIMSYGPDLVPEERLHENERTGERILDSWTVRVVNTALDCVRHSLRPVFWVTGTTKRYKLPETDQVDIRDPQPAIEEADSDEHSDTSEQACHHYNLRRNPRRTAKADLNSVKRSRSSSTTPSPAPKKMRRLKPDGGGKRVEDMSVDRLPSDIKGHWESKDVTRKNGKYLDSKGCWKYGMSIHDQARPLRQIYTYCVEANARYGFLITCEEVLLVRVSLLREEDPESAVIPSEELIRESMIEQGRLEFKSIRWGVHRDTRQSLDDFQKLTVNFSLWILFILAGNNSQIGWDYEPLEKECLARIREISVDENSSVTESNPNDESGLDRETRVSSSNSTRKALSPPLHDDGTTEADDEVILNSAAASFNTEGGISGELSAAVAERGMGQRGERGRGRDCAITT